MNWNYLHLIKGDNINIAYHYPTSNMMVISDVAFQVMESLKAGMLISEMNNINEHYKAAISSFIQSMDESLSRDIEVGEPIGGNKRSLTRITLHVSNDCNLRCKYCFAGGGNYNQPRDMMTIETAKAFVDFCIKNFDKIDQIVFFGGEPMLNIEIMEFICNQFRSDHSTGKSPFIPKFCIITNGTILTPKSLQFIKENISIITVSVDGPKEINDVNRVYKNGEGSFTKISQFIRTIQKETNIQIHYEATFTQSHIDAHYKHIDIVRALKNELGITGVVVNDNRLDTNLMLDCLKDINCEDLIKNDFEEIPVDFWRVLHTIVHKEARQICPIVKEIFAVSADGLIYPCQILNGIAKSSLGSINGDNIFNLPSEYTFVSLEHELKDNDKCKDCWAQKLCGGCAVQRFYNKEAEAFNIAPNVDMCNSTQQYLEQMLLMIATIRKKPDLWAALVEKESRL